MGRVCGRADGGGGVDWGMVGSCGCSDSFPAVIVLGDMTGA